MERGAALWPFDGSLAEFSSHAGIVLAETYPAEEVVRDGFGEAASGEDAFDAFAGLPKMTEIADGCHPEATIGLEPVLRWEGWILGR